MPEADQAQVSIIIPALNEAASVGAVVTALRDRLPNAEVLVIDDGSTDDTARRATKAGARVIQHKQQQGYGAALRTGTLASGRAYVLFCDADGQHAADDVSRLIAVMHDFDMVVGSRNRISHAPLLRRPGKFILAGFANYLAGVQIPDLNSGLRVIRRDLLLKYMHLMPRGFSFSTTSTFAMLKTHRRIEWIPITVAERTGSSTVRQMRDGPKVLLLMLRLTVLFEPLKVFLLTSASLFVLSLISLCIDIANAEDRGIGDTTVILTLSTVIVFLFGLICDQVSAIRRELHER